MKRTSQTTAVARAAVEVFDPEGRGMYADGQEVDDARAAFLLARYPQFFKAGAPTQAPKGGEE